MDFLDSVMELLNGTPSPPINVVNHNQQVSVTDEAAASALLTNNSAMDANSFGPTAPAAAPVVVTSATAPSQATAIQSYPERNLALKLPLLSSSSSDSESENPRNATGGSAGIGDGERSSSPPPNCAICLGRCKNKCFTDSCMHQFCFKCLCEWSKVKPECPLCKQTFKSIIHNVKSIHQFEEYHVQPPTVQIAHPPFEMDFQEMRIFGVVHPGHNRNAWNESAQRPFFYSDFSSASPYSSSSNTGSISSASGSASNRSIVLSSSIGSGLPNQYVYRGELLDLYRQDNPGAIGNSSTLSHLWRRYVYDRKLYAMPLPDITGRFRESSARLYRDNPVLVNRLTPWINRDVICLLRLTNHDVTTVLESINSALTLMNILSPAFRRRLQPYLGNKTAHFIHELNNFARSPYDMIGYDRAVQYSQQTNEEIVIEFTSSDESTDNEHIDVAGDGSSGGVMANTSSRSSRSANAASTNAINLTIHNRLTSSASANAAGGQRGNAADIPDDVSLVIDLRGESDNNETTSTGQATINSSNGQIADGSDVMMSNIQPAVAENIELTSGSSDECEFILERKPPHLRTPEMVSLDSESDSDVVFVDESKPLNKTLFSSSDEERHDNSQRDSHNHQHNTRNSAATNTRSKITALVEAKKRNNSENVVKSETQDSQLEIFNMGASTSAALRLSIQKRNDKSSKRSDEGRSRRLRREKYSLRNYERPTSRKHGKHLDSETSHSSTSTNSSTSTSSLSDSSSTDFSTSSSDEDYVANLPLKRRTSLSVRADSSTKCRKTRKTKKRKSNSGTTSHSRAKRDAKKRKMPNTDNSSEEDANKEHNGQSGKNFALIMAMYQNNKRCSSNIATSTGDRIEENESEGENSWRLKAVNEPLRRQQQQQQQQLQQLQQQQQQLQQQHLKSSHKSAEHKRHRKNTTAQDQTKQLNNVYREKGEKTEGKEKVKDKHIRKRSNIDKRNTSDKETAKPQKNNKFNYDDSSSDESDNINLIELKSKLTGQDHQNKEAITDINNVTPFDSTPHDQETATETLNDDVQTTNNTNNSNDMKRLETDTASTIVATKLVENLEASTIIPDSNNATITNETENNLPSTSHSNETTTTTNLAAITAEENNLIESILKNDLNASDDSNGDGGDNGQNNNHANHSNGEVNTSSSHETHIHNDNTYVGDTDNHQETETCSSSLINQNHNLSSSIVNSKRLYQSDISEDDDDDDDEDDNDDEMSSKTNPNSNLNVFPDATSMSATTTDTILHDAAEQISSAAVNFYNPQQHQQQPFNTADFADENSTNTSSTSGTSLSTSTSTSSSSSSSSSISSSFNANIFMNFKNV